MKEELKRLGLTENEATVYLSLLELGSTSAGEIIKKTKLHRNIVYENLEKLIEKGLVTFILIKNIKHFEVTSPLELKEYIEKQKQDILDKEQTLKKILPEIEKRREISPKEEAAIFRGTKALKTVMEEITNSKTEILLFATGWGMKETMGIYFEQWHEKLRQNKIPGRAVLSIAKKSDYPYPYKIRYIPKEMTLPSTIVIYENKILNVTWQPELMGFLIVSKEVADSYKEWFNLLWKNAKP